MIADTKDELAQAQADEDLYYQQFLQRVRAMAAEGQVSYWEILFQSSSFSDLLDRFNFVNDVMKYDNDMIDNLEAARLAVDAAEQKLEEEQAEQQEARDQLEAERTELEETAQQEEAVLQEILANEEIYSDQIAALSTREEELAGQISAAEEEYAAEQARLALEAQRRKEEEERRAAEEAARQAAIRQQEEEERRRQEEENQNAQELVRGMVDGDSQGSRVGTDECGRYDGFHYKVHGKPDRACHQPHEGQGGQHLRPFGVVPFFYGAGDGQEHAPCHKESPHIGRSPLYIVASAPLISATASQQAARVRSQRASASMYSMV